MTNVLPQLSKRGHENVLFFNDPEVGLKGMIAVHNTVLGPALGGCRVRNYPTEAQALEDVLRLSEGMTYKSAISGLDLGGGKAVIIADPNDENMNLKRDAFFASFGRFVERLNGSYITAEDMGTSIKDMGSVQKNTKHVVGKSPEIGGVGDPSPWTAIGTMQGMRACAERVYGSKDLKNKTVLVQGVGSVGRKIVTMLKQEGANVIIADTNETLLQAVAKESSARVVQLDALYDEEADIFCPCAIGQTVNETTIPRLKTKIIAGSANNQLSNPKVYSMIEEKGMVYAPDFAINAGGVIAVSFEALADSFSEAEIRMKVDAIYDTVGRIVDESRKRGKFTEVVALELAKERINAKKSR